MASLSTLENLPSQMLAVRAYRSVRCLEAGASGDRPINNVSAERIKHMAETSPPDLLILTVENRRDSGTVNGPDVTRPLEGPARHLPRRAAQRHLTVLDSACHRSRARRISDGPGSRRLAPAIGQIRVGPGPVRLASGHVVRHAGAPCRMARPLQARHRIHRALLLRRRRTHVLFRHP